MAMISGWTILIRFFLIFFSLFCFQLFKMLAPDGGTNPLHSTNNDVPDTETSPITGSGVRIFRRFGAILGASTSSNPSNASDGYVEFGISDSDRSTRTLGTFAGVFSPVSSSMFSALLFIRVGKICQQSNVLSEKLTPFFKVSSLVMPDCILCYFSS